MVITFSRCLPYFFKYCRGAVEDLLVEQSTTQISQMLPWRPYYMSLNGFDNETVSYLICYHSKGATVVMLMVSGGSAKTLEIRQATKH